MNTFAASTRAHAVCHIERERARLRADTLVVEEPLEIRVVSQAGERVVTVTMRTPGADEDLALGFLLAERVIETAAQVKSLRLCGQRANVIKVELRAGVVPDLKDTQRNFMSSASCGLCGKTSLEAVAAPDALQPIDCLAPPIRASTLHDIPRRLRAAQQLFDQTGGLHAVAAFDIEGELLAAREDIGRHNALDKVIGALAQRSWEPATTLFALSGRIGVELVQKAVAIRVPVIVAIGAPSSLAVDLAERAGITLIGFLRSTSFNAYTHAHRLAQQANAVREAV